ncbi:hypothetical protein [Actinokineospora sp. UTMC 2448]|uniref:hypothetical protein n=1 Tax=Actinokineospora sp. UTMC 2448 TaxID=2268449 RepID=UPI002164C936|nr:hypothetical protein [Actinokineospora sp. UTMC 2448]UVS80371.1 hypothetical protein Actkin_04122 [Actinokineospora sp. UTMC 2448]
MNTAGKLAAYGAAVVLVAAGAWAVGSAVGPFPGAAGVPEAEGPGHGGGHSDTVAATPHEPAGLASSKGGYTLTPVSTTLTAGRQQPFSFRVTGPDGHPVTAFDVSHDKRMHLIVVRRDLSGFQHVHPEMSGDGVWSVPLTVDDPGVYRAFADFVPTGGQGLTLGVDLFADGDAQRVEHQDSWAAEVDGYRVQLSGDLVAGRSSEVTATVTKDGVPVTDLQPYLGAYGHLVALRSGDLAYLHVHPDGTPGDGRTPAGPDIGFGVEVPTEGAYRLFLDFQHDGEVRTAEFTVTVSDHAPRPTATPPSDDGGAGHGEPGHGH